jgi:hypothetical protein
MTARHQLHDENIPVIASFIRLPVWSGWRCSIISKSIALMTPSPRLPQRLASRWFRWGDDRLASRLRRVVGQQPADRHLAGDGDDAPLRVLRHLGAPFLRRGERIPFHAVIA